METTTNADRTRAEAASGATVRTAAVVGGSGYTGALLAELLLRHPSLELTAVASDGSAGTPVAQALPRVRTALDFCAVDEVEGVDAAFLCLPERAAAPVARRLLDKGTAVVDLSPDFRLGLSDYQEWYGSHPYPEMLPGVYGLPELYRDEISGASLVANPGCYPTAALLALAPLAELGLTDVIVDAKSGVSGAGKKASERTHFCTVDSDLVAYGVTGHRHYPEIAGGVAKLIAAGAAGGKSAGGTAGGTAGTAASAPTVSFTPHLVPLQRGITETIYVRAEKLPDQRFLRGLYEDRYAGERFVDVCDEPPHLRDVVNTNSCRLFPMVDRRAGRILVISAIDNLMKGASGQAIQNMNLMLGLPETEGLS